MCRLSLVIFLIFCNIIVSKKFNDDDKPEWAKKDIRDYSEADLERLLDQWEEDEEPLPDDELPEHLRPQPQILFDPANIKDPENLLKLSKRGKTLMMFVKVRDKYSIEEAEEFTKLWQSSLWNNHIQAERYMIDGRRAIFMFKDGSQAWEAKDFLIEQEQLSDCTIDNKPYYGKFTQEWEAENDRPSNKKRDEL